MAAQLQRASIEKKKKTGGFLLFGKKNIISDQQAQLTHESESTSGSFLSSNLVQ